MKRWIRELSKKFRRKPLPLEMQADSRLQISLSLDLSENEAVLQSIYNDCLDVVFRRFYIGGKTDALLLYIGGLVNVEEIDKSVLAPLMILTAEAVGPPELLVGQNIPVPQTKTVTDMAGIIGAAGGSAPGVVRIQNRNQYHGKRTGGDVNRGCGKRRPADSG